jgi:predicted AAA+ superfamily ATPase
MERSFVKVLLKQLQDESPLIHFLVGPRQVGKTTGIQQLLQQYKGSHYYTSADAVLTASYAWVIEQWQAAKLKAEDTLLVIDEIQKIPNWGEVIKKLWDEQKIHGGKIKLLLSGSSSLSLQKGITESLAGRFEVIYAHHWDYCESNALLHMSLNDYLAYGGYPKSYELISDPDRWNSYMQSSIIDRVIDKDILQYAQVKNPALFRQAFEMVCCYPAQEISYRKLLGQLQDKGNTDLVKYYLSLFESAFLIKTIPKYNNQDYKIKSSSPKILTLAPCFYNIFNAKDEKYSFVFESSVGAKLLQIANKLYYWRQDNYEVNFIMQWRKRIYAIEVKSGRKVRAGGLEKFISIYTDAIPVVITPDNYISFVAEPTAFFEKII